MSRARRARCLPGAVPTASAVTAVLVAVLVAAVAGVVGVSGVVPTAPAPVTALKAPVSVSVPVLVPGPVAVAEAGGRGPVCDPGAPRPGGVPAVPPRAGGEHAQLPAARQAPPGGDRPPVPTAVRVLVRGPEGERTPGPVELSVLRV